MQHQRFTQLIKLYIGLRDEYTVRRTQSSHNYTEYASLIKKIIQFSVYAIDWMSLFNVEANFTTASLLLRWDYYINEAIFVAKDRFYL